MKTQDWRTDKKAKALIIGHDPRLQESDTIAEYALFANYYFSPEPKRFAEKRKFFLAKSAFDQILFLTNNKISPDSIYITNLCNDGLPHAPKGKTVFIPEIKAREGIEHIEKILRENSSIEYIFPMSLQVNYWLQKLGFYSSNNFFVEDSEPKDKGLRNSEQFYEPKKTSTFLKICGNIFKVNDGKQTVIPTLHSKNFPLKGKFLNYADCYNSIQMFFK